MTTRLSAEDESFLRYAIDLSRHALEDEGKTPFGAIVVVDGAIVGEGKSSVIELCDPTAHAEVMAVRHAATATGNHLLSNGVMYSSSEPCPMCLMSCYWAQIPRVVFGATSHDVAVNGFEDLQFYRELANPAERREMREDAAGGELRKQAADVLRSWADQLPFEVEPKL